MMKPKAYVLRQVSRESDHAAGAVLRNGICSLKQSLLPRVGH